MKYKVCCIGAGGTGGYFLKEFSRYLGGFRENISGLYVIDGDIVEEHNLSRQCFAEEDIGLPYLQRFLMTLLVSDGDLFRVT